MQAESTVHFVTRFPSAFGHSLWIALTLVASLTACGDDTNPATGSGGTEADAGCPPGSDIGPSGACFKRIPCPDSIPDFALGLEVTGKEGRYKANIDDASPSPPGFRFNDWVIEFTDPDGKPLSDVEITESESFMPAHNHDGFVAPMITPGDEPGLVQARRINLWMYGPWEVRFWVTAGAGDDYIVFPVCVE